jgi:competence protein ComEC
MAFGVGIWLEGYVHRPALLWELAALALAACAIAASLRNAIRFGHAPAILAFVCAGAAARVLAPVPDITIPTPDFLYTRQVEVTGHITSDGAMLAGAQPRERFDLESESIATAERVFLRPVGMRVNFILPDESRDWPRLFYGERVRFRATLRVPRNFRNPGAFDYEGYLHGLGISTIASVADSDITIMPGTSGSRAGFLRSTIRRSILEHVHNPRLWSEQDAALFAAMIVGDDSLLLRGVREEFQETGVYHLLVVSGMNVGLLALVVYWLAKRLNVPQWAASAITIALSLFYAFVAGMGVPILRAVLMLSIYLAGRLFYRDRGALNATGFAALVVLVLSPHAWFEPSFQLTFLALLAISGISLPVLERTAYPLRSALLHFDSTRYDLTLPPHWAQFRLDLRLIAGRMARFIGKSPAKFLITGSLRLCVLLYELLTVSSITQAVLVIPMRVYFHRAAIVGLPANLLVLPLAGLLMNAAVIAIALSYIYLPIAHLVAQIAVAALHSTLFAIVALSRWKIAQWRAADPGLMVSIAAAMGIVVALAAVRRTKAKAFTGIGVLFAAAMLAALYRPSIAREAGVLEITAIDVGQGDSLLVISPEGLTMLVDGGGEVGRSRGEFDYGEDVVSPYLWSRGIERLDAVVLTHAHADHIGGLPRIIENFHPRELWLGINPEIPALARLEEMAIIQNVQIQRQVEGNTFRWGGAEITVLSPPADWEPQSQPRNNDSLTFRIAYGNTSALLAGDAEEDLEDFIADDLPHVDLLKVAHHGSSTSTTPELLEAARPRYAVISVGAHNTFGHPDQEVLERLQETHVITYRTDMAGVVTFLLDGTGVKPQLHESR